MRVLVTFAVLLACACATTTKIVSEPPGAVVENEQKKTVGKTPMTYESKMWIWESDKLTLKSPGHKAKVIEVKRSDVDFLPMAGGICLSLTCCGAVGGVPLILAGGMKFPDEVKVKLDAGGDAPPTTLNEVPGDVVCMKY